MIGRAKAMLIALVILSYGAIVLAETVNGYRYFPGAAFGLTYKTTSQCAEFLKLHGYSWSTEFGYVDVRRKLEAHHFQCAGGELDENLCSATDKKPFYWPFQPRWILSFKDSPKGVFVTSSFCNRIGP